MILHLFDDEKVVNRAIDLFEDAFPEGNIYIVRIIDKPKYVQANDRIIFYKDGDKINDIVDIDNVTIHSMQLWKIELIKSLSCRPKRIWWCIWGADMYNSILSFLGYRMYYEWQFIQNPIRTQIIVFFSKIGIYSPSIKNQLEFIKEYVTDLKTTKEEYEIQKLFLGSYLKASFCEVPTNLYYSIDDVLSKELLQTTVSGNLILVGNSASISNNHLYAYQFLKKLDIGDRKIVSPLSYGGTQKYRDHIVHEATLLFNERFIPLIDFMPLDEYNNILAQSAICIYGNWRQEAMGNIVISLYLGAKVFLSNKSPLLKRFYRMGIKIFCLEDITQSEIDTPLSSFDINRNREILFSSLNRNTIINGIRQSWG